MMDRRPIGIFDSGVGGLTVLKEIRKTLPNEDYIYFGDNSRAPYGSRDSKEISNFCLEIGRFLEGMDIKLLIIACNTATVVCLEELEEKISVPTIGVIASGTKEALELTKTNKIGILSTPLTAKVNAYKNEAQRIDETVEVYQIGCEPLCQMIESGWEDNKENQELIRSYVDKFPMETDVVVFGCTHYPIIEKYFIRELKGKKIVDPAKETALEVENLLRELGLLNKRELKGKVSFYTSGNRAKFKQLAENILGRKIGIVKQALN